MNRREFFSGTAKVTFGVVATAALAACNGQTIATITKTVSDDLHLVSDGLQGALGDLGAGNIATDVVTKVTGYVNQIAGVVSQVSADVSKLEGQGIVTQVEGLLNSTVSAVANTDLPALFQQVLHAASALLPVIEGAVGLVVAALAPADRMDPAQARLILAAAAQRR